ncbi:hypothetical protein J4444_03925 [Candidatus Woesearchaeota archaeon]|nr:hypothetical protein [Candidatus Woesearchaeota archaeon]
MEIKRGFLGIYLLITIAFGILGLVDVVMFLLKYQPKVYSFIAAVLSVGFFILSAVALFVFWHHRVRKIVYVLPLYQVISYILFSIAGIYLFERPQEMTILLFAAFQIVVSIFEIGFSVYLLRKMAATGQ